MAVRLTRRATWRSVSRSGPTSLPPLAMRRNSGPWAMRASLSQVWRATTGQVASLEPRPISTSRQPTLTLVRTSALVENLDPAGAVVGVVGAAVEAGDFGAAQTAGKADQQDGAVAQAAQVVAERRDHRQQVFGQHGLLLVGRPAMAAANAAHHLGYVTVGAIEGDAVLGAVPCDGGEPSLDGAYRAGLFARRGFGGAGGEIEADHPRVRGQGVEVLASAPGGVMAPVGRISALRRLSLGAAGVVAGGLSETLQVSWEGARIRGRDGEGRGLKFRGVGGHSGVFSLEC
jgi:hypothetical protein